MVPLRILAIQTGYSLAVGGARVDFGTLDALARQGHVVRIVMPGKRAARGLVPTGMTVQYTPARGLRFPQSLGLVSLPWILREAKDFLPDIIRDHSPYAFAFASLIVQWLLNVPVVASFLHPEAHPPFAWVERNLLRRYAHITTISQFSTQLLNEIDPATAKKTSTVYMGISAEYTPRTITSEATWRAKHNLPLNEPIFCTASSLTPRKNHFFLLKVMQAWVGMGYPGVLIIVGDGPQRAELAQAVETGGLAGRVLLWQPFLPAQELAVRQRSNLSSENGEESDVYSSQEDYLTLLNIATAFLFPSKMEGFGFAPAEALACGLPALVSDRGALPEVVQPDTTGYVLPLDAGAQPWVDAMYGLWRDERARRMMGARAIRDVRARFNWGTCAKETAAVYRQVIAAWSDGNRV